MRFDTVVVAPNSAIDSYYELDQLIPGSVNVARRAFHIAGGKGINLARALKTIGGAPICLGVVGGEAGHFIEKELDREQIPHDLIKAEEESRRCNTIHVHGWDDTTVILEKGEEVKPALATALSETCLKYAADAPICVLTGSLPAGFPSDFYARLLENLKPYSIKVSVDTSGEPLKYAAEAGAAIIKVNRKEFESAFLTSGVLFSPKNGYAVYLNLQKNGLEILVVTDGSNGAFIFLPQGVVYKVKTKIQTWVSSAGAGDTFLAAMIYKLNRGSSLEDVFLFASAVASASMQELGCGILHPDQIPAFLSQTSLTTIQTG